VPGRPREICCRAIIMCKDSNSDKERGEKRGILDTDRAKQLDKTKDSDDEDSDAEE